MSRPQSSSGDDVADVRSAPRVALASPRPRRPLPLFPKHAAAPLGAPRPGDARHTPVVAIWELTLRCDLACRHCTSRAAAARPDELTTAEALDLVRQLAELGCREVSIIGGEAYLRADWLEIVRAIRAHGMMATMVTGGRSLTRERADAAAEAGIRTMSVSIDGEQETHDRVRGPGSHAAAIAAVEHIGAAGMAQAVNTQLSRVSWPEMPAVLERIAALGARAWQVQVTVPMGRAADDFEIVLQPYDLIDVFPLVGRLVERCRELGVAFVPGNNLGYFGPYEHMLRGGMASGHGGGCGAGQVTLGIESDGTIKPCPSLATEAWTSGSVREHALRDIWERAEAMRFTRDRGPRASWGRCASCYYAEHCRAGCTWMSDAVLGKPGNNPYCHHRAIELRREGLRERVERVSPPDGTPFDRGTFRLVEEAWPAVTAHSNPEELPAKNEEERAS